MSEPGNAVTWRIRLAQASPLIAAALFAALWLSVPGPIAGQLIATAFAPQEMGVTREMRAEWVDLEAGAADARRAGLWGTEDSLQTVLDDTYRDLVDRQSEFVSTSTPPVKPLPFSPDDPVYADLCAWEKKMGAHVWAWVLLPGEQPVWASAVGDRKSYATVQAEVDAWPEDVEAMRAPEGVLDVFLQSTSGPMGAMQPLDPSRFTSTSGGGMGSDAYWFSDSSIISGSEAWRVVILASGSGATDQPPELPAELRSADPRSPGFPELVKRTAQKHRENIWVLGPLGSTAYPLRVPEGGAEAASAELAELVWPAMNADAYQGLLWLPMPLSDRAQAVTGDEFGLTAPESLWTSDIAGAWNFTEDEIAPQTVLFLTTFDEMPGGAPGPIAGAWRGWRRWVAGWFPWLIGAAIGLLAVSLIASPVAFVVERRRRARLRVREEMARMQRDAHDKVYNRLSALSKRVAEAGDATRASTSASLGAIAEDIRGTVGELQDILGDDVVRTESGLATQPLQEQLRSVCAAQAARLGVDVECDTGEGIPALTPRAGWDLQCIAEEAITNSVRHGGAAHITVGVRVDGATLVLRIADDGGWTDLASPADARSTSTGLRGMRERLAAYGGQIDLSAAPDGVVLSVSVPLERIRATA